MVYLDYSATTKVDNNVLKCFNDVENLFFANPNSNHRLGKHANKVIMDSAMKICSYLNIKKNELIFTSGASESNNMVLKGCNASHIITTKLEHSSITTPVGYLQTKGIKVSFVPLLENGLVDTDALIKLIGDEDTLVSICMVNSETGIRQDIEGIGKILSKYPNVLFHSDITQALGKIHFSLENVDLASFSLHKIYGFKGIGGLVKKEPIRLTPLIHGGKAFTIYRSGTPQTGLIASSSVAFINAFTSFDERYSYVSKLNNYLKEKIKDYVIFNSNDKSIPHILNFSLKNINSDDALKYFSEKDIFISSKTACSSGNYSFVVNELYHDMERAENSLRVSISYKTTYEELDIFIKYLKELVG
ncbi:MAG: cysteine desulfurase family protein [bacterium]|nr:cysteine desulfurase family protein [bacterium]